MGLDDRLVLSSSFGVAAAAYAEHRPDYARAAVRWALEPAPGPRVLDLGAGTGKLTATLVALGADVVAADPAMLAELRRAVADVRALPGSAEAIPLPDACVDAVLAGNAMTLATRAGMLVMHERERQVTFGRVRAYLASRPETSDGEFTLPMLTGVLRVRRL